MSYTCVSCGLVFNDVEGQRDHMKSEWHRYNLKRRVAQLPPIDEATFSAKISSLTPNERETKNANKQVTKKEMRRKQREALQQQRSELLAIRDAIQEKLSLSETENKTKRSELLIKEATETSIEDELTKSELEKAKVEDIENSDPTAEEERLIAEKLANRVEISSKCCLFCPEQKSACFQTVEENTQHMFKAHGLYLPESKYLVDLDGLILYLGEKIGLGNVCLVCSYQGRNVQAVREHMQAKRHMRIPYESDNEKLEISDFYDFTSTYDIVAQVENDTGDNEDWEDVSDSEGEEEIDDDTETPIVDMGTELVLPSGAVIGHRSLARYYRQNLPPERILSEGQGTVIAAETRHFINSKSKLELASQKRAWSRQKKREDINDRRAAKFINNQPHFRDPLLQ